MRVFPMLVFNCAILAVSVLRNPRGHDIAVDQLVEPLELDGLNRIY